MTSAPAALYMTIIDCEIVPRTPSGDGSRSLFTRVRSKSILNRRHFHKDRLALRSAAPECVIARSATVPVRGFLQQAGHRTEAQHGLYSVGYVTGKRQAHWRGL